MFSKMQILILISVIVIVIILYCVFQPKNVESFSSLGEGYQIEDLVKFENILINTEPKTRDNKEYENDGNYRDTIKISNFNLQNEYDPFQKIQTAYWKERERLITYGDLHEKIPENKEIDQTILQKTGLSPYFFLKFVWGNQIQESASIDVYITIMYAYTEYDVMKTGKLFVPTRSLDTPPTAMKLAVKNNRHSEPILLEFPKNTIKPLSIEVECVDSNTKGPVFLDKILITSFINKENPTTGFPVNSFATVNPDRGFGLLKNKEAITPSDFPFYSKLPTSMKWKLNFIEAFNAPVPFLQSKWITLNILWWYGDTGNNQDIPTRVYLYTNEENKYHTDILLTKFEPIRIMMPIQFKFSSEQTKIQLFFNNSSVQLYCVVKIEDLEHNLYNSKFVGTYSNTELYSDTTTYSIGNQITNNSPNVPLTSKYNSIYNITQAATHYYSYTNSTHKFNTSLLFNKNFNDYVSSQNSINSGVYQHGLFFFNQDVNNFTSTEYALFKYEFYLENDYKITFLITNYFAALYVNNEEVLRSANIFVTKPTYLYWTWGIFKKRFYIEYVPLFYKSYSVEGKASYLRLSIDKFDLYNTVLKKNDQQMIGFKKHYGFTMNNNLAVIASELVIDPAYMIKPFSVQNTALESPFIHMKALPIKEVFDPLQQVDLENLKMTSISLDSMRYNQLNFSFYIVTEQIIQLVNHFKYKTFKPIQLIVMGYNLVLELRQYDENDYAMYISMTTSTTVTKEIIMLTSEIMKSGLPYVKVAFSNCYGNITICNNISEKVLQFNIKTILSLENNNTLQEIVTMSYNSLVPLFQVYNNFVSSEYLMQRFPKNSFPLYYVNYMNVPFSKSNILLKKVETKLI